jgi:hypothetical protein
MPKTIDDIEIFEYLTAEDLSMAVQFVNERWRALSQRDSLWNRQTFTPPVNMPDENVT